jgi:TetR/AcrR family transcriptional regulator, regulator of cefoperazone and chloramphenicol sensitivity
VKQTFDLVPVGFGEEAGSMIDDTRQRLIDAAGTIFAEKGYEATSVREICQKASANVAAISYHFGDKQSLYVTVVRHAQKCADADEPELVWPVDMPPIVRLREYVRTMLERKLDPNQPHWHLGIMLREMAHPTEACATVVDDYVRPMADGLRAILCDLLGSAASEERVNLIGFSIVGQVLFHYVHQPVIKLLIGQEAFSQLTVKKLADHITDFSLAAMGLAPSLGAGLPATVERETLA